jgi:hypothetical protein
VQLIDILGDLGGFAFHNLDRQCDNSFDDADGNRYITCINADYAEDDPDIVVVTPRGNWTGRTKGGLILSRDQCRTFTRLPMPYGITEKIDRALANIEHPNVNSGWAALSADGRNIVWSVADQIFLPADMVLSSRDGGSTFQKAKIFDLDGRCISDLHITDAEPVLHHRCPENETAGVYAYGMKVFSDRVDPELFYGFGRHFEFYVSCDGGATFRQKELPQDAPCADFTIIDTANRTEVRGDRERTGRFYMALREHGLYRIDYDRRMDRAKLTKLSGDGDVFYRMGLGAVCPKSGTAGTSAEVRTAGEPEAFPAIYTAATIGGTYGFYRTTDEGRTFVRLNTDAQMFGEINSIEGDSRVYGRFYIATGSRGVLYGEPARPQTKNNTELSGF